MQKNVLCFGDSNTWGYAPGGERYGTDTRWPRRMAALLGDEYDVIEEGLNGRTCLIDDPVEGGYKSGAAYLPACLMSHNPLDLVIIMLGTNDTKQRFGLNAFTIAQGVGELIKLARRYALDAKEQPAKVVLASPIEIGQNLMDTIMGPIFGPAAIDIAKGLGEEYRKVALLQRAEYINIAQIAKPCPQDAIHLSADGQLAIGMAMADKVRAVLGSFS